MIYSQAEAFINDIPKFTKKNNLAHTNRFLEKLGNPQQGRKVLHVAGTNGKGSVCIYLEHLLRSEGRQVGTFISPHLVVMNERIRINGTMVSEKEFLHVFDQARDAVGELQKEGLPHPTFFEFLFGMAMKAFANAGMEYIILETGLGGRMDATNCIPDPIVTLIASIGMDHMQYLGNTVEEIAGEKAGIIMPHVPVFYLENSKESVNSVFETKAKEMNSPCRMVSKSAYEILEITKDSIAFSCTNAYYEDTRWELSNIGIYQVDNAVLALEAMRYLLGEKKHLALWQAAIREAFWEGRMEKIAPKFYVDGAHNLNAMEGFAASVSLREERKVILFSAVADKDYEDMIAYLCEHVPAEEYVVTTVEDDRAARGEVLGEVFERYTMAPVTVIDSICQAVEYVEEHQGERTVYCLGSLYLVGTIKKYLRRAN